LKDNFIYSDVTFFNISQGLDLTVNSSKLIDRLTRLYVNSGLTFEKITISFTEFYFHKSQEHQFTSAFSYNETHFTFSTNFQYNSYNSNSSPVTRLVGYDLLLKITDLFRFKNKVDYNIETKVVSGSSYSILYTPINNCWKIEFNYARDLIDQKVGLLLSINYNENNFASINLR
jgi:LPS-assembly protein